LVRGRKERSRVVVLPDKRLNKINFNQKPASILYQNYTILREMAKKPIYFNKMKSDSGDRPFLMDF
jgi:hypothetical protein